MLRLALAVTVVLSACTGPTDDPPPEDAGGEGEGEGEGETGAANGSPCTTDDDCAGGACTAAFSGENFVVEDFCTLECETPADCADAFPGGGLCIAGQARSVCFPTCDGAAACDAFAAVDEPADGFCVVGFAGVGDTCLRLRGTGFCDGDADCGDGEACIILNNGGGYASVCFAADVPETGDTCDATLAARVGEPCGVDGDCPDGMDCADTDANPQTPTICALPQGEACANGFCWPQGVCAGPCAVDDDCPTGLTCQGFEFAYDQQGNTDVIGLCRPFAGSGTACTRDADCTGGEVCGVVNDDDGDLAKVCRLPAATDLARGAVCGDDPGTIDVVEPTAACGTDVCVRGRCGIVCVDDADCGADATCFVPADDSPAVCLPGASCASDAACAAGQSCTPFSDGDGIEQQCMGTYGTLAAGAACSVDPFLDVDGFTCIDDASCDDETGGTGWTCALPAHVCAPPADQVCASGCVEGRRCGTTCAQDTDCPTDMACVGDPQLRDDQQDDDPTNDTFSWGGRCQIVTTTVCTKNADCTTTGHVCKPVFKRDGTGIEGRCGLAVDGAAAVGAACGRVAGSFVPCAGACEIEAEAVAGTCRAVCAEDGDCAAGTCQTFDFGDSVDFATAAGLSFKVCK